MRLTSHLLIALVALTWSSAAAAKSDTSTSTLSPAVLSALADLDLDAAFERATWPISNNVLKGLGGPTTMNCTTGEVVNAIETCEVSAEGLPSSMPASLAQK